MLRYATLHQLFDAPLSPLGINEISQTLLVDLWDFDSFSDYVLQEIPKLDGISPEECIIDAASGTLVIPLKDNPNRSCPLPASELAIRFTEDMDGNRSLLVSYRMVARDASSANLRKCVDLLPDMEVTESDGQFSCDGAYGHYYTISEDVDEQSITFSCQMPVPAYKWYSVPSGYMPTLSYNELPDYAPCNQGEEPFNKFLKKFNKDSKFRIERRIWSDTANHADRMDGYTMPVQFGFNEYVLKALDESGLLPLRGHYDNKTYKSKSGDEYEEYVESCGQWFYPTQNSVIYSGWNIASERPEDNCGMVILFERVDGEWNTTATWYSGTKLSDIIDRLMQEAYGE